MSGSSLLGTPRCDLLGLCLRNLLSVCYRTERVCVLCTLGLIRVCRGSHNPSACVGSQSGGPDQGAAGGALPRPLARLHACAPFWCTHPWFHPFLAGTAGAGRRLTASSFLLCSKTTRSLLSSLVSGPQFPGADAACRAAVPTVHVQQSVPVGPLLALTPPLRARTHRPTFCPGFDLLSVSPPSGTVQ